jgi:hypothetical protein
MQRNNKGTLSERRVGGLCAPVSVVYNYAGKHAYATQMVYAIKSVTLEGPTSGGGGGVHMLGSEVIKVFGDVGRAPYVPQTDRAEQGSC